MKRKFLCPACGKKFSLYQMPDHLDSCPDRKHYNQHLALFRDLDEYRNQCYMEAEIEMKLMPYVQHLIGCPERGGLLMPDPVFAEYANRNRLFVIKKSGQEVIFNAEMFKMGDFIIVRHFKCSLCEFHVYAGEVALRGFDAFIHSPCYKKEDRI